MFKFLKEKLKNVFGRMSSEIEEKSHEDVKQLEISEKNDEKKNELKKENIKQEIKKEEAEKSKKERILDDLKGINVDKSGVKDDIKSIEEAEKELLKEEVRIVKEEEKEKKSIFSIIKERFTTAKISEAEFDEIFEQLELTLLENNVAVSVIDAIKHKLKGEIVEKALNKKEIETKIKDSLRQILSEILLEPFSLTEKIREKKEKPFVIVFFGINGAGKTTAIAKVAHFLQKSRLKCVLAASDTFRAASIEQLEKHAANLEINVIKHNYGADPAAVAHDAITHAKAAGKDVVLIDTAGRMHTKSDLMREMEKITRVSKPDLKIFVGESITGNDAVEQANAFNKSIGIDAIILTKADVDEKGGAMISVSKVTGKPILFLGTGQGYEDLEVFSKEKVIKSIFC